jgi:hypothetical protein
MGRAGPLAVDYAMIVIRISSIGRFHRYLALDANEGRKPIPNAQEVEEDVRLKPDPQGWAHVWVRLLA